MRNSHAAQLHLGRLFRLAPLSLAAVAALSAACTPNLDDKLSCLNSTQCPTGYFCGPDGKCQAGDTVPEITLITPVSGVIFSGVIQLQMSVIDPAGVTSVTVGLSGSGADAGAPVTAVAGQNSLYTASLDTRALGVSTNGGFGITITATNSKGKIGTLTAQLQLQDQSPGISNLNISPSSVVAGQAAQISFDLSEAVSALPVVKLSAPDGTTQSYAAAVSFNANHYVYRFIPLAADPIGAWKVKVTAEDAYGNSASSSGNDTLNVIAGGSSSVTITGVRGDQVSDARAFYLNSGATVAVTATFGAGLTANPGAFLCPIGSAGPCSASSTGSQALLVTPGTAANSYTFSIGPVVPNASNPNEGNHVLTVTGTSSAGASVSGSANVVFDFTKPAFSVQSFGNGNPDSQSRQMVSLQDGTLRYFATTSEPLAAFATVGAVIDSSNTTSVQQDLHPTSLAILPQFVVTLGAALASTPPVPNSFPGHVVNVTICDLANNCATAGSQPFVEVDQVPAVFAFDVPTTQSSEINLPDGGFGPPPVFRPGQTVAVGIKIDRELASNDNNAIEVQLGTDAMEAALFDSLHETYAGDGGTPFGYTYQAVIPSNVADGQYPVEIFSGYDGYNNQIASISNTIVGPSITIKSSVPNLVPANSGGGTGGSVSEPNAVGPAAPASFFFVSQSNGVADDLTTGSLVVCINPSVSGGTVSCPGGTNSSSVGGLTATISSRVGSPKVGEVDLTVSAGASPGDQLVLIQFTDIAGNVGILPFSVVVDANPPVIYSWFFDQNQLQPKGVATMVVTFADASALNSGSLSGVVAGGLTGIAGTPIPTGNPLVWKFPFTMPAQCDGSRGVTSTPFNVGVTASDVLGNAYNSLTSANPLTPAPSLTCVPVPAITNVSLDKTILPASGSATATISLSEALGNVAGATVNGSTGSLTGVTTSALGSTGARQFKVKYTMPASCNGGVNPTDGVPFPISVVVFDGANSTTLSLGVSLTCANLPRLLSYSWDKSVVQVGGTATATLSVNEPLTAAGGSSATTYTSGLSFNPTVASGGANAVANAPLQYTIAYTFSSCGSGNNPPEATPVPLNATLNDGVHAVVSPLGAITCTTTSIAGATVNPALIQLLKQPFGDGTLRSIIVASPGAITGWSGSGAGVTLTALNGGVVGSGALKGDGSVEAFELNAPYTQLGLAFTDLLGNSKQVLPGKYPEQLNINTTGALTGLNQNPFQVIDVSTGDDTYYPAGYWVDGGPGPDGGVAGSVLGAPPGGGAATAVYALSALSNIDGQILTINSAPAFVADAGTDAGHISYVGAESFGNPILINGDAGQTPFVGPTPAPRVVAAAMAASPYSAGYCCSSYTQLYLEGGYGVGGVIPDPQGTFWTWTRDNGWSKNSVNSFDGGNPGVQYAALGFDNSYNFLVLGGANGAGNGTASIAGLFSTPLGDGGVQQWWGDAGVIYQPLLDGGAVSSTPLPIYVFGSATGQVTYGVNGIGYTSTGSSQMTVMNANYGSTNNCMLYVPGGSGYGAPIGSYTLYPCANAGGLAGALHQNTALATATDTLPDGGSYGLFAFGGKYNGSNYASNDFYGGQLTYSVSNGVMNVNWIPLIPAASSPTPVARSAAYLYYIPQTNKVGLYGGVSAAGTPVNDNWEFDLTTNIWTQIDNPHANAIAPSARNSTTAAGAAGSLYLFSGSNQLADGWVLGRETRDRVIAKLPIASQLSSPAAATLAQLNITLSIGNNSVGVNRAPVGLGRGSTPDLTSFDSTTQYDVFLWNGTTWAYVTSTGGYAGNVTIPASALPSITTGDGNIYVMVAGPPTAYSGSNPYSMNLDALEFSLSFQ